MTFYFLKFRPHNTFLGKRGPETSKCFVLNKTRYLRIFRSAYSALNNSFHKFCHQNNFLGKYDPETSSFFVLNDYQYLVSSRVLILNSTIVFLKSVPKTPFWSKFDPQTQKYFVLNGIRYKWLLKGADSEFNNAFLKTNHELVLKFKSVLC